MVIINLKNTIYIICMIYKFIFRTNVLLEELFKIIVLESTLHEFYYF